MHTGTRRALLLHLAVLAGLFALQFVLPDYHHRNLARILVLASYAAGYNLLLGYTGLLSLGHAMLFAAGLYGAGLAVQLLGVNAASGFAIGVLSGLALAVAVGLVALRTSGVAFMIVTLMFSQAAFLTTLYFAAFTRGDEGFVLPEASRQYQIGSFFFDLSDPGTRYNFALLLFAACLMATFVLVRSPIGRVLVAIRENEQRTTMLGYHTFRYKLLALAASGAISGAAGAAYALLFSYVGSTFASIQYSILPLLWVLLGGVGTTLGPLIGTVLMFYLVDVISGYTSAYLLLVGVALVLLVLVFPKGILGTVRAKAAPWLP
ncbi:MAG: leucine/isoleucine/valine transporter permease subunit [Rhodospirillales bacterium]|jgi:branched-chain amino acid transport system permease protein|nr:leucine/isoleucine/valine transporter permease subunit [Rhodospirillales bacterium]